MGWGAGAIFLLCGREAMTDTWDGAELPRERVGDVSCIRADLGRDSVGGIEGWGRGAWWTSAVQCRLCLGVHAARTRAQIWGEDRREMRLSYLYRLERSRV